MSHNSEPHSPDPDRLDPNGANQSAHPEQPAAEHGEHLHVEPVDFGDILFAEPDELEDDLEILSMDDPGLGLARSERCRRTPSCHPSRKHKGEDPGTEGLFEFETPEESVDDANLTRRSPFPIWTN